MKKIYSIIIILVLILGFAFNIFSEDKEKVETTEFNGKLKKIAGQWFLNTGEDFFQLEIAPNNFLEENKIVLTNKMDLKVKGIMQEELIVVHTFIIDEIDFKLRNEFGEALWQKSVGKEYYVVNPKKCISCRLCVKYCPFDAIEMVDGFAVIDVDKCTSCGICEDGDNGRYKGCPTDAIKKAE